MKKITTIIVTIIVIIGLVIGTGIFLVTKFINPNTFKDKITEVVYQKTGRELNTDGTVDWSFFPWVGIRIDNLSLNNTVKFKNKDFAKIDSCNIELKVLPLVFGKIIIDKIVLNNIDLKLIRNNEGDNNWSDLLNSLQKSETSAGAVPFLISDISITNANISMDDQQNNQSTAITNLELLGKNINATGTPFLISLKSNIKNINPDVSTNISFSGDITVDLRKQFYAINNLQIKGNLLTSPLVQSVPFGCNANIVADAPNQTLNVNDLNINFSSITANGAVKVTNIFYAPNVVGNLVATSFDPKPLLQAFGILDKNINPTLQIFKNASFKVALQTTSKFLKIPTLEATLDSSLLSGQANYSHFGDKLIALNLDLNQIDLDQYLALLSSPPQEKPTAKVVLSENSTINNSHKKNKNKKNISSISTSVNPIIAGLRQVKIDGDLHIGNLKFTKMNLSNVNAAISGDLGLIQLDPLTFNWYQGKVQGSLNVDVRKPESRINGNAIIAGASIKPLFGDLINNTKVSGILFANTSIMTKGNDAQSMLNNLNGKGNLKLNKAIFYGIDVRYQIDKASSLINKKTQTTKESDPPRTDVGQMTSDFVITNGALLTNNLLMQGSDFKVKGHGTADLVKQMFNFILEAYGKKTKFYVPIKLTGPFMSPSISPDLSLFIGSLIDDKVTKELGKQGVKIETDSKGDQVKSIKLDPKKLNNLLHF